jgi:type IV pilus assembly protein PilN
MKITLNLATRPYADQGPALKRLRIGMAVLAVVLLLLGFGLEHFHQSALRMAAQQDQVNQAIARIQREEMGYQAQMQLPPNARVLQQAQFLNKLFDEKSFSWTAAMEDLERVLPAGVQVTAIEPSRGKDGRLTLHLRISGQRERSVEMVRNMEHSRRFAAPRISGENAENSAQGGLQQVQDSGRVNFDVLAEYNPATLEERKAQLAEQKKQPAAKAAPKLAPNAGLPRRQALVAPVRPQTGGGQPGYIPPNPQPVVRAPQMPVNRMNQEPRLTPAPRPGFPPSGAQNPNMNRSPNGMPRPVPQPVPQQNPQPGGPQ